MSAGIAARVTVLAVTAALLLAGCGSPPPPESNDSNTDPNSPQNSVPNKPAIVTLADTVPVPFVDLDCASLVPAAVAQAAIAVPITPQPVVLSQGYLLTDGLPSVHEPMTFSTQIAKGFTCEWSNGEPQVLDVAQNPDYAGIVLDVLPNATDTWNSHLAYITGFGGTTEYCTAYATADCEMETLIDGTWYRMRSYHVNVGANVPDAQVIAAAKPVIDAAVASIAAATPKTGKPGVLAGTASLSEDCNQFFTPPELDAATGISLSILPPPTTATEIYGLGAAADQVAKVDYCSWYLAGNSEGYYDMALLSWLEGGEWAFAKLEDGGGFAKATALDVPGLSAKEGAYIECFEDRCAVDVLVSHDWIWFSIWLNSTVSTVTPNAAATAIAAKIVEEIG
jgi:hypothetical protein